MPSKKARSKSPAPAPPSTSKTTGGRASSPAAAREAPAQKDSTPRRGRSPTRRDKSPVKQANGKDTNSTPKSKNATTAAAKTGSTENNKQSAKKGTLKRTTSQVISTFQLFQQSCAAWAKCFEVHLVSFTEGSYPYHPASIHRHSEGAHELSQLL
jgi:hypothetical protein